MIYEIPFAAWAIAKRFLMPVVLSIGLAGGITTPAVADKPQFRNIEIGGGINIATIIVEQEEGKWTRISDHPRTIPTHVTIEMSRGYIQFYRVGRNLTNGAVRDVFSTYHVGGYGNGTDNPIGAHINSRTVVNGPVNILIDEHTRLNASDEQAIVDHCNSKWTEIESGHSFSYSLPLAVHADAREHRRLRFPFYLNEYEGYGDFARATATGFVGLKVECLGTDTKPSRPDSKPPSGADGAPRATNDDPASESGPVQVRIDLDLAGGNACPRNATVKTRIVYAHSETARFDIVRNGKVLKTVEIEARRDALSDGSTQWVVDRVDSVEAKAGQNQFRVIVKGGGKSGMKVANVECAPFQVLFSDLTYNVAKGGTCPIQVWETATFSATGPGEATMQLVQKSGSVIYEKKLESILKNGDYRLVNQRVLSIDRDTDTRFRVQIKGQSGSHSKWAKLKVTCPKRANPKPEHNKEVPKKLDTKPKTSYSPDKAAPRTSPAPKKKAEPARINPAPKKKAEPARIDPLVKKPQIVCKGGKISGGKCQCGKKKVAKKLGKREFACVARRR